MISSVTVSTDCKSGNSSHTHVSRIQCTTYCCSWCSFMLVVRNFLGNHKVDNYSKLVENMICFLCQFCCKMSIKVHYLYSHLDRFPDNLDDLSEKQGERFHQDLRTMEEQHWRHCDTHMMESNCWNIDRDYRVGISLQDVSETPFKWDVWIKDNIFTDYFLCCINQNVVAWLFINYS